MTTETTTSTTEAELEGEAPESAQMGVMYSERTWIVKPWMKALTFWLTVASIGGLAVHEVQKRRQFSGLLIDSVVEPEAWLGAAAGAADAGGQKAAPEVALNAVYRDGKEGGGAVKLSDFKGKWVMLNYWATWCAPCRDEMPSMEMLNRRLGKDLVMVAVSVDDDVGQIARFFGDTKPTFTVLWDNTKASARAYGTSKFPETYLIDPQGNVAAKFTGPRDWYNQGTVQYFNEVMTGKRKPISS